MTTNQNMLRKMGNFEVTQRTKDGFFNATALLKQWNEYAENSKSVKSTDDKNVSENQQLLNRGNSPHLKNNIGNQIVAYKEIKDFFFNNSTKEFIKTIMIKENLSDEKQVYKAHKGKYGGTWMHPMLFIDFAMWLNPTFKYDVLKFVHDEMIKYRNLAGDSYKELSLAVAKIVPKEFIATAMKKVAEAINWIIFKEHRTGIRNDFGDEQKQQELFDFQRKIASLIDEGFIKSFEYLMEYLRNSYKRMNLPKVFLAG